MPRRFILFAAGLFTVGAVSQAAPSHGWTSTATGPLPGNQAAVDVAIDSTGNVLVAGRTRNAAPHGSFGWDFTVIKLAGSDGRQLWRLAIDGMAARDDMAQHILVDQAGDAYVAGFIVDGDGAANVSLIKLRGTDGALLWRHAFSSLRIEAIHLAADGGSIYVAGDPSADLSATVFRLSAHDGSILWDSDTMSSGGRVFALDVDPISGDILAGGEFCADPRCPFDMQGQPQPRRFGVVRLDGATGTSKWRRTRMDLGRVQTLRSDGSNVWAMDAGLAITRLTLDDGSTLWTRPAPSEFSESGRLSLSPDGNGVASGSVRETQEQFPPIATVFKLDPWGGLAWSASAGEGGLSALVVDTLGHAVAAGTMRRNDENGFAFAVVKMAPTGAVNWKSISGPEGSSASAVAVDHVGNVVAAGRESVSPDEGHSAWRVVKLAPDGADYQCVNGTLDPGDECDDGNQTEGDGCDTNCSVSRCGNAVRGGAEQCDDGNLVDNDGCDSNCRPTGCPNGVVTAGEECDDGNQANGDGCDANCTVSRCGNGLTGGAEQCDDGNVDSGDGCDANCTLTACGNGIQTDGEACDDGNAIDGDSCDANCTPTACGNGIVTDGEQCDDGNLTDGDGCQSNCTFTPTATATRTTTVTQTPSATGTVTRTGTQTYTPTITRTPTRTPTVTLSPTTTRTRTATATRTVTSTPTRTATPRVARLVVGTAVGAPGQTVQVTVSLSTAGFPVAATANDLGFDATALSLTPGACVVNRDIKKTLVSTILEQEGISAQVRFFVQSTENTLLIPDGPLYTCAFRILPGAPPRTYQIQNTQVAAFDVTGRRIDPVSGSDGAVRASLVPLACPGDCNGNGAVVVNELVTGVGIALGTGDPSRCPALDLNGDERITIEELVRAVGAALNGCS